MQAVYSSSMSKVNLDILTIQVIFDSEMQQLRNMVKIKVSN